MNWDYGKLTANKVELALPRGWWMKKEPPSGLPGTLCADGKKGVTELSLRFPLEPGFYELAFTHGLVTEPSNFSGQFWILFADDREIGCGGIAPVRLFPEEVAQQETKKVRFRCARTGEHRLTLLITNVDASTDCPFELREVALKKVEPPGANHSLLSDHPGRCFIDVWGWMNCLSYQRPIKNPPPPEDSYREETRIPEWENYFVADLGYQRRNVIEESYRWGANGQEFYLLDQRLGITHWPMSWAKEDPIPGGETYGSMAPPYFQDEELRELARLAHRHDSLFHWYGHIPDRDAYPWHRNFVGPGRTSKEWIFNLLSKMARDFGNVLTDKAAAIDGFAAEYMELMEATESGDEVAEQTRRLWRYNPGAYLSDNTVNTWDRPRPCASPAFSHTLLGGWTRDDFSPNDLHGDVFRHGKFGKAHFNLQGDCRGRSTNFFGGWIGPDLIVKECNDFFRPRALEPADVHNIAVWWIGESRFTTPGLARRYVYGLSQDPVKAAAAYFLPTLGKDGKMEQIGRRRPYRHTGTPNAFYRRRSEYPPDTAVIHNNHLALYLPADSQDGELFVDLEGLAHFDSHGLNAALSPALCATELEEGIERVWTVTDFPEPAGYKAVLRQQIRILGRSGRELREERIFTAHNDTPYLRLRIARRGEGKIETSLGVTAYDTLRAGGEEYGKETDIPVPPWLVLADSAGVAPSWAVLLVNPGTAKRLRWRPGKEIAFLHEEADGDMELAFVALGSLYQERDFALLGAVLRDDEIEGVALAAGMRLTNDMDLPRVVVARLNDPAGTPYLVQENGWWMFRGAQPGTQDDFDYVKVYLRAKSSARVVRYGFIDGVVKPGWGCQYTLAIGAVAHTPGLARCDVKVFSVIPNLFAPRVEFSQPIGSAKVNGRPWRYCDGKTLFLPNRPDTYQVEVSHEPIRSPHLTRTFARVESCRWENDCLVLEAGLPLWCKELHPKLKFTAAISTEGRTLGEVRGGAVLQQEKDGAIIEFSPGEIVLQFA